MTWSRSWSPDPAGPHQVAAAHAPVLAAVLRAFDPAETDSRLLVTSRFTFTLDGLEDRLEAVQLRPLSEVAQRKLQRRQQALDPAGAAGRAGRAGGPGGGGQPGQPRPAGPDRAAAGLRRAGQRWTGPRPRWRAWRPTCAQGDLPADAEVRAFLENLALDTLLDEAGPANVALLRAVTLFDLPVPEPVIEVLAGQVGGSAGRLRGPGPAGPLPRPVRPGPPGRWPPTRWPPGGSTRSPRTSGPPWPPSAPGRC